MNSIWLKTKELLRFYSGYHGELVSIGIRYVADAIVSGNLDTKYEPDMT